MADELFKSLGFRVDIAEVQHPDGRVVVFEVPSRPRGTAYHLNGRYLMRSGASLVAMSEDRLRQVFAEGKPDWLEEVGLSDCTAEQVVDLLDTQGYFELLELSYPTDRSRVLDVLVRSRLVDRLDDRYAIRRLGGLLLAKRLDDFPDLGRKAPRVVVYGSSSKLHTRIDLLWNRGYATGFRSLVEFVMQQLPQNEIIEKALRRKVELLPAGSVRELLANCLVHMDFAIGGAGPVIEMFPARVVISNPGRPIVSIERFIDEYQSRNEHLADFMRRMRICEERGSGIDRVVQEAELHQLPAPRFETDELRTIVTVFGPKKFEDMDRDDRIRACYQHCALKWALGEKMTNQSLRERFGLPERRSATTSQIITATIDAGMIRLDESAGNSRKFARYLPSWA